MIFSNSLAKTLNFGLKSIELISSQNSGTKFSFIFEDKSFHCNVQDYYEEDDLSLNYEKLKQFSAEKKFISTERNTKSTKIETKDEKLNLINFHDTIIESTYKNILSKYSLMTNKTSHEIQKRATLAENFTEIFCSKKALFFDDVSTIPMSKCGSELYWGSSSDMKLIKSLLECEKTEKVDQNNVCDEENIIDKIKKYNNFCRKCNCYDILVIDEDDFNNYSFKLLIDHGFRIECTSDPAKALRMIKRNNEDFECCMGIKIVFMSLKNKLKESMKNYNEIWDFLTNKKEKTAVIAILGIVHRKRLEN